MFLNSEKQSISQWKETLLSFLVAVFCSSLVYFFPVDDFLQNLTKNIFFLLVIPFFYVKLVLQKDIRDFGINWDQKKTGALWGSLMFLFLAVLFFFIIRYTEFDQTHIPPAFVKTNFLVFSALRIGFGKSALFSARNIFQRLPAFRFAGKTGLLVHFDPINRLSFSTTDLQFLFFPNPTNGCALTLGRTGCLQKPLFRLFLSLRPDFFDSLGRLYNFHQ